VTGSELCPGGHGKVYALPVTFAAPTLTPRRKSKRMDAYMPGKYPPVLQIPNLPLWRMGTRSESCLQSFFTPQKPPAIASVASCQASIMSTDEYPRDYLPWHIRARSSNVFVVASVAIAVFTVSCTLLGGRSSY
jgi:hypothetical protein